MKMRFRILSAPISAFRYHVLVADAEVVPAQPKKAAAIAIRAWPRTPTTMNTTPSTIENVRAFTLSPSVRWSSLAMLGVRQCCHLPDDRKGNWAHPDLRRRQRRRRGDRP